MGERTCGDFYREFGFADYPFSSYTSEDEKTHQGRLFVDTSMYSPVVEAFASGRTIILAGDRGTGKTAIIYDFLRRVNGNIDLTISVSDFADLSIDYNVASFYRFLLCNLADKFFRDLPSLDQKRIKLSRDERISLSYFLATFTKPATQVALNRQLTALQTRTWVRIAQGIYRYTRYPLNIGSNATVNFLSTLLSQSFGSAAPTIEWKEYFPEIAGGIEKAFNDADASHQLLSKFIELVKKCGYSKVIFIFDKVDEDTRLENAAEEISDFIKPILSENKFLLDENYQVGVAVWVIPFNHIKDQVRTQKIYCPTLQWSALDLQKACENRMAVFSGSKIGSMDDIFADDVSEVDRQGLFDLCNRNPRDLWHIMDHIFKSQYKINSESKNISSAAIKTGLSKFVKEFNFFEYYPKKSNAKSNSMDIYAYIKHLLKLDTDTFTRNQLNERAATGSSTNNYAVAMENMGLIERSGTISGALEYKIRDPKIVYAIKHGVDISRPT